MLEILPKKWCEYLVKITVKSRMVTKLENFQISLVIIFMLLIHVERNFNILFRMPLVLLPRKGDELVQEGVDGSPSLWGL